MSFRDLQLHAIVIPNEVSGLPHEALSAQMRFEWQSCLCEILRLRSGWHFRGIGPNAIASCSHRFSSALPSPPAYAALRRGRQSAPTSLPLGETDAQRQWGQRSGLGRGSCGPAA